ncbi:MAG TPA: hypothetical protein VEL82_01835 [Thermoplasmata archaeon]|nr:hypothetical protein [Thermoplasmata archaeon]
MRGGLVVLGIILAVLGAALLFVPLLPQSNETVTSTSSTPFYEGSVSGYSLTGSIPVAVSWSTNGSVAVEVAAATASCSGTNCANVSGVSGVTFQNGTSGSFMLDQPNGGTVVMGVIYSGSSAVVVTFKITTALATVGTVLLIVGIVVLILGVVLRGKPKPAPAAMPPASAAPVAPPGPPPS